MSFFTDEKRSSEIRSVDVKRRKHISTSLNNTLQKFKTQVVVDFEVEEGCFVGVSFKTIFFTIEVNSEPL